MLVVPDAAPAFRDQNSSHLFKWSGEGFSAEQSVFSVAEKLRLTTRACLTNMKYGMRCCFSPKPITYTSAFCLTQEECGANVKRRENRNETRTERQTAVLLTHWLWMCASSSTGSEYWCQAEWQERQWREFHLLCRFVVAWTGHVGHVGCYGLDLPHELISNPGIVLKRHRSAITHDAEEFPVRHQGFISIHSLIISQISLRTELKTIFQAASGMHHELPNKDFVLSRVLTAHCGSLLFWWLLPATAINSPSSVFLFIISVKPQDVLARSS